MKGRVSEQPEPSEIQHQLDKIDMPMELISLHKIYYCKLQLPYPHTRGLKQALWPFMEAITIFMERVNLLHHAYKVFVGLKEQNILENIDERKIFGSIEEDWDECNKRTVPVLTKLNQYVQKRNIQGMESPDDLFHELFRSFQHIWIVMLKHRWNNKQCKRYRDQ